MKKNILKILIVLVIIVITFALYILIVNNRSLTKKEVEKFNSMFEKVRGTQKYDWCEGVYTGKDLKDVLGSLEKGVTFSKESGLLSIYGRAYSTLWIYFDHVNIKEGNSLPAHRVKIDDPHYLKRSEFNEFISKIDDNKNYIVKLHIDSKNSIIDSIVIYDYEKFEFNKQFDLGYSKELYEKVIENNKKENTTIVSIDGISDIEILTREMNDNFPESDESNNKKTNNFSKRTPGIYSYYTEKVYEDGIVKNIKIKRKETAVEAAY